MRLGQVLVVLVRLALLFLNTKVKMMANYAIIENGKVINTVVAEADYAATQGWVELTSGGIDWDYIGGQFVDNRPVPEVVITPAPTKEQLMAQLAALSAQIQALE